MDTLCRFLYVPTNEKLWALVTLEFYYRWETIKSGAFQRITEKRENMKK